MARIKLIGVDLDGTLLNRQKQITSRTLKALALAQEQGVVVVPVTGRPFGGVPAVVTELPGLQYVISSNGATVRDAVSGITIMSKHIPAGRCLEILEILAGHGVPHEVFWNGLGYAEQGTYDLLFGRYTGTPVLPYYLSTRRAVEKSLAAFVRDGEKSAEEILILAGGQEKKQAIHQDLKRLEDLSFISPFPNDLEVTAQGIDKGESLLYLARKLGIAPDETMAFGDEGNDLALLEKAGFPVAMGNASEAVKAIARYVTASNEEDGVALAIEKFVLKR